MTPTEKEEGLARIRERLSTYATTHGLDASALHSQVWGRMFGVVEARADRLTLAEAVSQGAPTVSAAVRDATKNERDAIVGILSVGALRQEAFTGSRANEASRLLGEAGEINAARLWAGEEVPLRDLFTLPAMMLHDRARNSLRSHLFKQRPASAKPRDRFSACVHRRIVIAWIGRS